MAARSCGSSRRLLTGVLVCKWWNGLWLRLRHARLDRDELEDVRDWRVILNYTLPIL